MAKYIDPLTDTGFKIIFGRENQSETILAKFLNDLFVGTPYFDAITQIKYSNSERVREKERGKTIIHDVICETEKGHKFILEMQKGKKDDFLYRSTYYTCRGVTDQVNIGTSGKGSPYKFLPVTTVYICDFDIRELDDKLTSVFMFRDIEGDRIINNGIRTAYIQLPRFKKGWDECENNFDKWIYILKNMYTFEEFPEMTRKDAVFSRLERVASYAQLAEEDKIAYEADLKWASEYREEIATAKREAAMEGRAEGLAQGRAEERWEMAKKLFDLGIDLKTISTASGLPIKELEDQLGV